MELHCAIAQLHRLLHPLRLLLDRKIEAPQRRDQFHPAAMRAPKEVVDRRAKRLALYVPEGNVDATDGVAYDAAVPELVAAGEKSLP